MFHFSKVPHLVESRYRMSYTTELNRIPAYFQLNGNNKRKKSEAFARMLTNTLMVEMQDSVTLMALASLSFYIPVCILR